MADQEFEKSKTGVEADASTAGDADLGQPKVNLDDIPEFRDWKSKTDRRLAEYEKAKTSAEQKAEQQALAGMDQYERAQYEAEKHSRRAKELEDRLMQVQADQYRQQRLGDISREYNVPVSALDDSSPEAALASALDYIVKGKKRTSNGTSGATAPKVDLGGGSPKGSAERLKERYRDAKKGYDSGSMIRIAAEAEAAGVSLD